ncbi:hypothetical protein CSKR_106137 [Clonorchis sinensis]|uniref:Uncharacterized protein n=1 Tax=Clonorchis sinensis TaxID=79923 RepID=A0A3R7JK65_CLOSI|nr:hypothetical protein CSKR_106137 [Clonorchis sinensis]
MHLKIMNGIWKNTTNTAECCSMEGCVNSHEPPPCTGLNGVHNLLCWLSVRQRNAHLKYQNIQLQTQTRQLRRNMITSE